MNNKSFVETVPHPICFESAVDLLCIAAGAAQDSEQTMARVLLDAFAEQLDAHKELWKDDAKAYLSGVLLHLMLGFPRFAIVVGSHSKTLPVLAEIVTLLKKDGSEKRLKTSNPLLN